MSHEPRSESPVFLCHISTDGFTVELVNGLVRLIQTLKATLYVCVKHREARQNVSIWPSGNKTELQHKPNTFIHCLSQREF